MLTMYLPEKGHITVGELIDEAMNLPASVVLNKAMFSLVEHLPSNQYDRQNMIRLYFWLCRRFGDTIGPDILFTGYDVIKSIHGPDDVNADTLDMPGLEPV